MVNDTLDDVERDDLGSQGSELFIFGEEDSRERPSSEELASDKVFSHVLALFSLHLN